MMTATAVSAESHLAQRLVRIRGERIEFIPNDDFSLDCSDLGELEQLFPNPDRAAPKSLPEHLQRMCESELLSFEQEQALFRAMNLRKYQAFTLRSQDDLDESTVSKIEELLRESQLIRDQIIKANMRLVMSIVKKFVSDQVTFDEMLSDGLLSLMNCVDKFDFDRGFRFSTYAYRSIARDAYRTVQAAKQRGVQFSSEDGWVIEPEDDRNSCAARDGFWSVLRDRTNAMLENLDRRERFIIRCRYALGPHRKVKSLQMLADKLGVSKERVRQLEIRAVKKLRTMASDLELDDVVGSAAL